MTVNRTTRYGMSCVVEMEYDRAVQRAKEELAKEGFGVLSEIDIAATLKRKLDVDFRPYVILGACNPPLAHRALAAETDLGLLLPCNVIVYASDEPGRSVVAAMDPEAALELTGNPEVRGGSSRGKDAPRAGPPRSGSTRRGLSEPATTFTSLVLRRTHGKTLRRG